MYYLDKCNFKGCTRNGSVALKQDVKLCNLHLNAKEIADDDKDLENKESVNADDTAKDESINE